MPRGAINQALVMQVGQDRFRNVRDLLNAFDFQNETQLFASMSEPEANETFVLFL
jgi:hypothetical protein